MWSPGAPQGLQGQTHLHPASRCFPLQNYIAPETNQDQKKKRKKIEVTIPPAVLLE